MVKYSTHKIIYYSAMDFIPGIKGLYKEWTGLDYNPKYRLWNSTFIVARKRENNEIVGVAQLLIIDDPFWNRRWGLVENVYVKQTYRRQGIGKGLMDFVAGEAELWGCSFIKLTSRKQEGKALYRALGYEEGSTFRKDLHPGDIGRKEGPAFIELKKRIEKIEEEI